MATWGGARQLVSSSRRWDFPDIDDQSPQHADEQDPEPAPRAVRFIVSGVVGLVVLGLAIAAIGLVFQRPRETTPVTSAPSPAVENTAASRPVIVHISGAVLAPGLVELDTGDRVVDAVNAAGGAADGADVHRLNLARPVMDGEHIIVPLLGDPDGVGPELSATEPISLSRSSSERLQELPGIGPAIAERIIAWREANGGFRSVDDALAVPGIGPATLERFRGQVLP